MNKINALLIFSVFMSSLSFAQNQKTTASALLSSPVREQGTIGFCWAYSTMSFLESRTQNKTGEEILLSANYLGLQNLYLEILKQLPELLRASTNLNLLNLETRLAALSTIFKDRTEKKSPKEGVSELQAALNIIKISGIIPEDVIVIPNDFPSARPSLLSSTRKKEDLKAIFLNFVHENLSNTKQLKKYSDHPHELYKELAALFHLRPILPNDEFNYEGKIYTPLTFKNHIQLKDSDLLIQKWYKDGNSDFNAFEQKIAVALEQQREVPIAFQFIADSKEQMQEQVRSGTLSTNCLQCESMGNHVVTIIGTINDPMDHHRVGYLAKNSWGANDQATIRGEKATIPGTGGYLVIPLEYLKRSSVLEIALEHFNP